MTISDNLWKFYIAEIFKGFWFVLPITILYLQKFGTSYTGIGILELAASLTIILLEIPTGAFADIFGRKTSVFLGFFITAVAMFTIGFSTTMAGFLIGYVFWSIGGTFESGAVYALIYDTLRDMKQQKKYLKIVGRVTLVGTVSLIAGLIVSPMLFALDIRFPWFAYGIAMLIGSAFYLIAKEPKMTKRKLTLKNHYVQMKNSLRYAMRHKFIQWLIFFSLIMALPMYVVNTFLLQPHLINVGFDIVSFSIIFPLIYASASAFSVFAYKIENKLGEKTCLFTGVFLQGIMLLLIFAVHMPIILAAVIILYVNRDFTNMLVHNYINHHTKSSQRATVLSIQSFIVTIGLTIASIIAGVLTDLISVQNMFLVIGLFTLVLGLPWFFKRYKF